MHHFYETLLTKHVEWRLSLDDLAFDSLNYISASWLERLFEVNEVYKMVCGIVKDKAQRPNGVFTAFFKGCWDVANENVMYVFQEFFSFHNFEKFLHTTFIALIPKLWGHHS